KQQYTIAVVTHNLQQAMRVADKTAFMYVDTTRGGRTGYLAEYDDTKTLFENPAQEYTRQYIRGEFSSGARGDPPMMARHCAVVFMARPISYSGLASSDNTAKQRAAGTLQLQGAGATFPAPLYKKWVEEYQKQHPDVQLSYKAIGSGEGIKQFMAGAVDFGASDAAMSDEEMAAVARGVQLLPLVAGSIFLAFNLGGLGGDM